MLQWLHLMKQVAYFHILFHSILRSDLQVWKLHQEDKLIEIVDHKLTLDADKKMEVQRVINVALLCLQQLDERRPTMAQVVAMLQGDQFDGIIEDLETSDSMETSLLANFPGHFNLQDLTLTMERDEIELAPMNVESIDE